MTLIQRFGSALNLNVHYHMLFLDGVYAEDDYGKQRFHRVKAPTYDELNTPLTPSAIASLAAWKSVGFWSVMPRIRG